MLRREKIAESFSNNAKPGLEHVEVDLNTCNQILKLKENNILMKSQMKEDTLKKNRIFQLNLRLKKLENDAGKLQIDGERQHQDNKIYRKALKLYAKIFQFKIEELPVNDGQQHMIVFKLTFLFINDQESKYPVLFTFDQNTRNLLNFSAEGLLTKEQHKKLLGRFEDSNNYVALFNTLRYLAFIKC